MTSKKLSIFLLFLFANISFGQQKRNPNIINKDIELGPSIESNITDQQIKSALASKNYNAKIFVYYNGKFFSDDTLSKIKNINDYTVEIIKIPDSITKDIQGIIYLKKAVK